MILITGGTGLVGSHLLCQLAQKKEPLRALYRDARTLAGVKRVFSYFTTEAEALFNAIEWVQGDITDIPSLDKAFEGIAKVYHCAALISFDERDYKKLRKINVEGTANIVNFCLSRFVQKLCYVSSVAALGKVQEGFITEDTRWSPDDANHSYSITKYGGEMEVWRGAQEGLPVVIVNPGVILGAGFWNAGSGKIFNIVKRGLTYYPPGSVGVVDVEDLVQAMLQLMESAITGKRYIVVAENLDYQHFLTDIARAFGVTPPRNRLTPRFMQLLWRLDALRGALTGKPRLLSRYTAASLCAQNQYSSEQLIKALHFRFRPVSQTIQTVCSRFNS